jgi:hypothetical protein
VASENAADMPTCCRRCHVHGLEAAAHGRGLSEMQDGSILRDWLAGTSSLYLGKTTFADHLNTVTVRASLDRASGEIGGWRF